MKDSMTNKTDALMDQYEKRFGDIFPTMCFQMDSEDEMAAKIQYCLNKGEPAERLFNIDGDVIY